MATPVGRTDIGGCAVLTLDRPQRLNAISTPLLDALDAHLDRIEQDDSRAYVIAGAGRAFCVGSDLKEREPDPGQRILRMHRLILRMRGFPKLGVAAIHGHALGGGLEIALGCTFRVADPDARLGLPEVKLSVIPCYGGTQLLPRLIGEVRALDMMLSGEPIDAATALAWGLVDRVSRPGEAVAAAVDFALKRAAHGAAAERAIREAVWLGADLPLDRALAEEHPIAVCVSESAEATAGIAAFLGRAKG